MLIDNFVGDCLSERRRRVTEETQDLADLTPTIVFTYAYDAAGRRTQLAAAITCQLEQLGVSRTRHPIRNRSCDLMVSVPFKKSGIRCLVSLRALGSEEFA